MEELGACESLNDAAGVRRWTGLYVRYVHIQPHRHWAPKVSSTRWFGLPGACKKHAEKDKNNESRGIKRWVFKHSEIVMVWSLYICIHRETDVIAPQFTRAAYRSAAVHARRAVSNSQAIAIAALPKSPAVAHREGLACLKCWWLWRIDF